MKYSFLTLTLSVLLVSAAVQAAGIYNKDGNKLDLYGKVSLGRLFSDDPALNRDTSCARLGFKGETQIGDQLTGYGQWQYNFSLSKSEGADALSGDKTQLGFAGLKYGRWGSLDYGRYYGLYYDALSWTDMLPRFGGESSNTDVFLSSRATGVATWRNNNFFGLVNGLDVALQYQGKNERTGDKAIKASNGDGYAASVSWTGESGFGVTGAYASLRRTSLQNSALLGKGDRAESWATAVKYDANQIYLATLYGNTRNSTPIKGGFANKAVNFEVVAQYQLLNGLRPSLAYISSRAKDIENAGDVYIARYASAGASYDFNMNFSLSAEYKLNLLGDNNPLGISSDDVMGVGMSYKF